MTDWSSALASAVDEIHALSPFGRDLLREGSDSERSAVRARWLVAISQFRRSMAGAPSESVVHVAQTALSTLSREFSDMRVGISASFARIDACDLLTLRQRRLAEIACTLVPLLREAGETERAYEWFQKARDFYQSSPEAFTFDAAALELDRGHVDLALDLIDSSMAQAVTPFFRMRQHRLRAQILAAAARPGEARDEHLQAVLIARSSLEVLRAGAQRFPAASNNVLQHSLIEDHAVIFEDASDFLASIVSEKTDTGSHLLSLELMLEALALWDLKGLHVDLVSAVSRRLEKLLTHHASIPSHLTDIIENYRSEAKRLALRGSAGTGRHLRLVTVDGAPVSD